MLRILAIALLAQGEPAPQIPNAKIAYVANQGNDTNAVLGDPTRPYATIAAGTKALGAVNGVVSGSVLLERGDTFSGNVPLLSGASESDPFVFGAYGDGPRPTLIVPSISIYNQFKVNLVNWRVEHIDYYCRDADPGVFGDLPPPDRPFITYRPMAGASIRGAFTNCRWRFIFVAFERGTLTPGDRVTFDHCVFLDSYSLKGEGNQGLLSSHIPLTIDTCVFDHNGWSEAYLPGKPTIFNHNAYLEDCTGSIVRNTVFARPSSIGLKLTANSTGICDNIVIDDNLFIDCEEAIDIGGNIATPDRFRNSTVTNNVFWDTGRTSRQGRSISWGMRVRGWNGGLIASNVMLTPKDGYPGTNVFFLSLYESIGTVRIYENFCSGVSAGNTWVNAPIQAAGGPAQRLDFEGNTFDVASGISVQFYQPPVSLGWRFNRFEIEPAPSRKPTAIFQNGQSPVSANLLSVAAGEPIPTTPKVPESPLGMTNADYYERIRLQGLLSDWMPELEPRTINSAIRMSLCVPARTAPDLP